MTLLFEAKPCEKRAFFLRKALNQFLISSLLHLLEAAEGVLLPEIYQLSLKSLRSLNADKKISSFLYALNTAFSQAYTMEDIPTIQKIAQNIAEHRFQIEGVNFLSTHNILSYHRKPFEKYSVFEFPGEVAFTGSSPD